MVQGGPRWCKVVQGGSPSDRRTTHRRRGGQGERRVGSGEEREERAERAEGAERGEREDAAAQDPALVTRGVGGGGEVNGSGGDEPTGGRGRPARGVPLKRPPLESNEPRACAPESRPRPRPRARAGAGAGRRRDETAAWAGHGGCDDGGPGVVGRGRRWRATEGRGERRSVATARRRATESD